jgi:hypothetical protein
MLKLSNVVNQLRAQRKQVQSELGRLNQCASGNRYRKRFGNNSSCFVQTTPHPVRGKSQGD